MFTPKNQYVLLDVKGTSYAIPSSHVSHVEMVEHITLVPNAHPVVEGVVFSRGQIIPALNLRMRFGFDRESHQAGSRIIFVLVKQRMVGLIADSAREFLSIPETAIRPIEETLTGVGGNYLKAVANIADRMILILDLEAVLNVEKFEPVPLQLVHEVLQSAKTFALTEAITID